MTALTDERLAVLASAAAASVEGLMNESWINDPGDWWLVIRAAIGLNAEASRACRETLVRAGVDLCAADANYLAVVDPGTVLDLVAEVRRYKAERHVITNALARLDGMTVSEQTTIEEILSVAVGVIDEIGGGLGV